MVACDGRASGVIRPDPLQFLPPVLYRTKFAWAQLVNVDGVRVLVVDDEPAIRALVAKIVDRAGLPVDTASDGSEAIARMEASRTRWSSSI